MFRIPREFVSFFSTQNKSAARARHKHYLSRAPSTSPQTQRIVYTYIFVSTHIRTRATLDYSQVSVVSMSQISGKAATSMPSISSSQRRNTFSGGGARVQRATTMKNTKTIQTTRFVPPPPPPRRVRRQGSLPPSPGFCSMISKGGKSLLPNLIDEKADKRNVTAKASSS